MRAFAVGLLAISLPAFSGEASSLLSNRGPALRTSATAAAGQPAAAPSCRDQFSPEKLSAGQDCSWSAGAFCPSPDTLTSNSVIRSCSGVSITTVDFRSPAGLHSRYIVLRGPDAPKSIYLALHHTGGAVEAYTNLVRLQELAKGRRTLVIVPQAPSPFGSSAIDLGSLPGFGSTWPVQPAYEPVAADVKFLDDVVADARKRYGAVGLPLLVAGYSNGGNMAYNYGCGSADKVEAIMAVSGDFPSNVAAMCMPSRSIGSVIVHNTGDPVNSYNGLGVTMSVPSLHKLWEDFSGCSGADRTATLPAGGTVTSTVTFAYSAACQDQRRHYLVAVQVSSHDWAGQNDAATGLDGRPPHSFDATLQGYDLLWQAAGH